jgi:transcriptional regulator with XRE-family HTH domain
MEKQNFRDNQERKRFCISLSKYRLSKGLSQDQLGKMLNMSAQNISRIECGFFSVGIDKVLKIVDVLGGKITIEDK